MARYVVRRLWQAVLVIFGVVTVVFFVLQLTGDPVRVMLGDTSSEEDIQNVASYVSDVTGSGEEG